MKEKTPRILSIRYAPYRRGMWSRRDNSMENLSPATGSTGVLHLESERFEPQDRRNSGLVNANWQGQLAKRGQPRTCPQRAMNFSKNSGIILVSGHLVNSRKYFFQHILKNINMAQYVVVYVGKYV